MRVAVITPYYKESTAFLQRCHDSVLAQTEGDVVHFMISDGFPNPVVDTWEKTIHIKLPNHGDYGDTPRAIGGLSAANMGFDAITLLDADNWFEPNHIAELAKVQRETGVQVVTGTRYLRRPDESIMAVCKESDGKVFNDTNCYLLMKPVFRAFTAWGFKDPRYGIIGDRIFWQTLLKMNVTKAHCSIPTVNYATTFATHYLHHGEQPPPGCKVIAKFVGEPLERMLTFEEWVRLLREQRARAEAAKATPDQPN